MRAAPAAPDSFRRSILSFYRSLLIGGVEIARWREVCAHRREARGLELAVELGELPLELAPAGEQRAE